MLRVAAAQSPLLRDVPDAEAIIRKMRENGPSGPRRALAPDSWDSHQVIRSADRPALVSRSNTVTSSTPTDARPTP